MTLRPLRTVKALYSVARIVQDPSRLDDVLEMATTLSTPQTMEPIVARLALDPEIDRALDDRHRIRPVLAELARLKEGSLGRTFADHMNQAKLDPSAIPTLPGESRDEYVRAHLYETHDIWHVVTGFTTDFVGELGLQGFYLAQVPGPLPAMLLAAGFLRSAVFERPMTIPFMEALLRGYTMGKAARPLFGVRWDELWDVPIAEVQRRLGLPSPATRDAALAA